MHLRRINKKVQTVLISTVLTASFVTSAIAGTTRTVNNPFISYLATAYNSGNAHYNWNLTNGTITVPSNDTFTVAAPGGIAPLVCMLGASDRIADASPAAVDSSIGQETMLTTAFPALLDAEVPWTGTGHGKLTGTKGATGLSKLEQSGASVYFDKPEETSTGEWFYAGNLQSIDGAGLTNVPEGYMATPSAYKEAVDIVANTLNTTEATTKDTLFDTYYDNYLSAVSSATSSQSGKKVLYIHSVTTDGSGTVTKIRSAYSDKAGVGTDDSYGYILTYYLTHTLASGNCTNLGDTYLSSASSVEEDGAEYFSLSAIDTILTEAKPDAIIFCNQADEAKLYNSLSADAKTQYSGTTKSAAPVGMYDAALRCPDTALAPAWLAAVLFNTYSESQLEAQASAFYTNLYGYTPSSSELNTMYNGLGK